MNVVRERPRELRPVRTTLGKRRFFVITFLMLALTTPVAEAQLDAACNAAAPPWARSPAFGTLSDPGLPSPVLIPLERNFGSAPAVGLSTTAANPAGLSWETVSARTEIGVAADAVTGAYRRPLDDGGSQRSRLTFAGAELLRAGTAISGGGAIERQSIDGGSRALFVAPYASNPFVPSDTNNPQLSRPSVCLHGAEATAIGPWSAGIAVAYRALDNTTVHSPVAALGRGTWSAVSAGIARSMGGVRAGIVVRGTTGAQTTTVSADPGSVRAYALNGYENVDPRDISVVAEPFFRREDQSGGAVGVNGLTMLRGIRIAGYWELRSQRDRQFGTLLTNPPTDVWKTSGSTSGAAAQTAVLGFLTTVHADYVAATGHTARADTGAGAYRSSASMLALGIDARRPFLDSAWRIAGSVDIMRLHQRAADSAADASTNVTSWQPELSIRVSRLLRSNRAVTIGAGLARYATHAQLPEPKGRGQPYEGLIAPAIEVAAAPAMVGQVILGWSSIAFGRPVSIVPVYEWMHPTRAPNPDIPLPTGDRKVYGLRVTIATSR